MEITTSFANSEGLTLAGILEKAERPAPSPIVIMCHGYSSGKNSKINRLLAPKLAEVGIASFRFDFPGHYDSEGDIADLTISNAVEDLRYAVDFIKEFESVNSKRLGLFGSSFGGTVALWFASSRVDVNALVLRSPASDYAAVREAQLGIEGIRKWKDTGIVSLEGGTVESKYAFYEDAIDHDTYALATKITAPSLIIHGDADDNVPVSQSVRLNEVMGDRASLEVVANAGHSYDKPGQLENVMKLTIEFFQKKLT